MRLEFVADPGFTCEGLAVQGSDQLPRVIPELEQLRDGPGRPRGGDRGVPAASDRVALCEYIHRPDRYSAPLGAMLDKIAEPATCCRGC